MILRASFAVSLLSLAGLIGQAAAQAVAVDARVVWVQDERVYIASSDSLALGFGAVLTFVSRGKPVATGEVARVVDDQLVVARLTSGSLARVKDPRRLRILSEPVRGPRVLRVAYPSRARSTLFFACDRLTLAPPFPPGAYPVEVSDHLYRLIPGRDPSRVPWPETLLVRQFDDSADEEIALERGEVDVAVFWPGELSSHMREQPRWQDRLSSPTSRGCVAALRLGAQASGGARAASLPDGPLLTSLNRELFRGDLGERWHGRDSGSASPAGSAVPQGARYEVDPGCPGRSGLEHFLARAPGSSRGPEGPVVRLFHLDCPSESADSIAMAAAEYVRSGPFPPWLRARADTVMAAFRSAPSDGGLDQPAPIDRARDALGVDLLFTFDCPVVFDLRLRPYVGALGAKRFVDLFDCTPTGSRP